MSVQLTFTSTLVDEWVRLGVTDAVVCAGSRSTPLALPIAERLRVHVRLDERSAAFFALGLAMASGRPTIICVTSGTAAAELHPAIVEAYHARVPLIVCTADRPPELHDTGAPQTTQQDGLFAAAVRWAHAPGVPTEGQENTWRPLAVRAFEEAMHGAAGPGPVHLNLAFREPLTGTPAPLPPRQGPRVVVSAGRRSTPTLEMEPLRGRGMIVAGGPWSQRADPTLVAGLADTLGWPVLADPLSGSRFDGSIAAADAIVRTEPPLPECIVLLATPWLSRALGTFVSRAAVAGARIVVVDPFHQWADPLRVATEFHQCEVDRWLDAALTTSAPCDPQWLDSWRDREVRAQGAIAQVLGSDLSEPLVARAVHRYAADTGATLVVAASMPIRDLEWYAEPSSTPPRVLANRGVNGIDGVVSTALGVAASGNGPGARTVALMGDLTFLHDVSGLVNLPELPCTIVVLDNGGGGIFSFLPQATSVEPAVFEQLFGTPPASDIGAIARGFGLPVHEVSALSQLEGALAAPTPALVRVRVPGRAQNVALHDAINQAVRLALP
ncbi:MAG: 2-succinyl-5-enolpyruvyl-6-hydroxy-3-cyclohexene-1-carboxylic-acid synthase [Acidimicrobiales bacterium]